MKGLRIMGACFLIAGAASCFSPMLRVMGICWVVVGVVMIGFVQVAAASEANRQRLLATGKAGWAMVLDVHDTGVTVNNSPRVRVKVRIDVEGEAPIEATHAMLVSRVSAPRVGEVYDVRFDPADPNNFTFAPGSSGSARASHRGAPKADETEEQLAQLERLTALRDKGALTPAEFDAQKRKLLGKG